MSNTTTSHTRPVPPVSDADSVSRAATELGVEVPRSFQLHGVGEDGKHIARCGGTAADLRVSAAICRRLDGAPIADCWPAPDPAADEKPAWAPPDDWTDTEAVSAYLEERDKHPEWPRPTAIWDGFPDFGLGVAGNATWDAIKWTSRKIRAARSTDLSQEDAILVGSHALVNEFVQMGLEPPNIATMTCRANQLKNGNWHLLFYGQHIVVLVVVSGPEPADEHSEVTILTCIHGIDGQ